MPEGISGAIPPISVRLKREEIGVKAGDVLDIQIDRSCFLCAGIISVILIIGSIVIFFLYEYWLK